MGARRALIGRLVRAAAIGLVAAACIPGFGGLPTHGWMSSYPAGLLRGTVVRDGDCVYVETSPDERRLPIPAKRRPPRVLREGAKPEFGCRKRKWW